MTVREVISNKLAAVSVRDLLLVEAVAMKRSFRYAAIDMGISTSGLSYQVKKVEEILGQPIFERGSKITPTAFGKEVLDLIAVILEGVTRLEGLRDDGLALPFGQTLRI
ncbi:LysR family transcriptional regulator, partial [Parasutterella excrementihominis]